MFRLIGKFFGSTCLFYDSYSLYFVYYRIIYYTFETTSIGSKKYLKYYPVVADEGTPCHKNGMDGVGVVLHNFSPIPLVIST